MTRLVTAPAATGNPDRQVACPGPLYAL